VLLAAWVLTGRRLHSAAVVQTAAIVAMNAGALIWSRAAIHDAGGMLVQNLALVALIWCVAEPGARRAQ
jgi:hypothetical protein